ncbi:hypothetical protein ACFLUT_04435 [Chloroflexota bacterium]
MTLPTPYPEIQRHIRVEKLARFLTTKRIVKPATVGMVMQLPASILAGMLAPPQFELDGSATSLTASAGVPKSERRHLIF